MYEGSDDQIVRLLTSIDATLKQLVKQSKATAPKATADDRDLDGKYGDPVIKAMPRDWTGPSFKNQRLSECPPELLDLAAEMFEYFADKAEKKNKMTNAGKPVAPYNRSDAARCRGWAKRKRAGWVPRETAPSDNGNFGTDPHADTSFGQSGFEDDFAI